MENTESAKFLSNTDQWNDRTNSGKIPVVLPLLVKSC